jgi:hypothetical protein
VLSTSACLVSVKDIQPTIIKDPKPNASRPATRGSPDNGSGIMTES